MAVIRAAGVWKQYHLQNRRLRTLKEEFVNFVLRRRYPGEYGSAWALRDVSFEVEAGETFGIIGDNGSGKSTLLKLVTGISKPTRGTVAVDGRVSALLELGAGFHPDFTGRENVFLAGAILGLRRREIQRRFEQIVEFAELGAVIDHQVKTYSSGMYMRLAFAVAVHVDPDILVVDEVLAVGDASFQSKCIDRIKAFQNEGKTILIVSHSLATIKELCSRACWLDRAEVMALGDTRTVMEAYGRLVGENIARQKAASMARPGSQVDGHHAEVIGLRCVDEQGRERLVVENGEPAFFEFQVHGSVGPEAIMCIPRIFRADGFRCYDTDIPLADLTDTLPARLRMAIPSLALYPGPYTMEIVLRQLDGRNLGVATCPFSVTADRTGGGIARLEVLWQAAALQNADLEVARGA